MPVCCRVLSRKTLTIWGKVMRCTRQHNTVTSPETCVFDETAIVERHDYVSKAYIRSFIPYHVFKVSLRGRVGAPVTESMIRAKCSYTRMNT